jgi:GcrA cell cycle regulator
MSAWPPARIAQLTALFHSGLSASAIAEKLGGGLSKNAVIGKLHRLGLTTGARPCRVRSRGGTPGRPRSKPVQPSMPSVRCRVPDPAVPPPTVPLSPPESGYGPVTILGLRDGTTRQCRWPLGLPGAEMLYCGAATMNGSSWCPHHHARVWQRVPAKRQRMEAAE